MTDMAVGFGWDSSYDDREDNIMQIKIMAERQNDFQNKTAGFGRDLLYHSRQDGQESRLWTYSLSLMRVKEQ
jgi:hypothetical protein